MKRSIVAIVYFGINHPKWWSMNENLLQYVSSIRTAEDNQCHYIIDQPILLTIIAVSKGTGYTEMSAQLNVSGETDATETFDQQIDNNFAPSKDRKKTISLTEYHKLVKKFTMLGDQNNIVNIKVRFGAFRCMPEDTTHYCIALLWRHETTCLWAASAQFGKVLYSTNMCMQLREHVADMAM